MQMTVPALRELDTLVNAEVFPLLQDHCLLFCVACSQYIKLLTLISRAKLVLIYDQFHEQTNFFNCMVTLREAELLLLQAKYDIANVGLRYEYVFGDSEESPKLE